MMFINLFKLVHKIDIITDLDILLKITFMIILILNPYIILYNLAIKKLFVTYLYFIKNQYMIFVLLFILIKRII